MRRGHQGIGGWRNENPRMFRQRNCGNPPFRIQRNFNQQNTSRFLSPGPRPHRPHFNTHIGNEHVIQDREWTRYRPESQFTFSRTKDKEPYQKSFTKQIKHGDGSSNYRGPSQNSEGYLINNMGDIDQRHMIQKRIHSISPWNHDVDDRTYIDTYKGKSHQYNKQQSDYAGHRPPASDHYGGNPIPTNENSNTFSRSVDDTVNIIRKRLLNRDETHQTQEDNAKNNGNHMLDNIKTTQRDSQYDQNLIKRKIPKPRKMNCERIKNKIVHQLFKMDKEKIHKLLDNPNSSTKFECALNSLLTESQNSFNKHMRSVAEKSLCTSSKDFMQNDNNTIYEDTFMKQMQCILDPQDTVLLEDIKPVVMAELSNLLQLDEVDSRYSYKKHPNFSYHNEKDTDKEYPQDIHSYNCLQTRTINTQQCDNYFENLNSDCMNDDYEVEVSNKTLEDSKPLFERRFRKKSITFSSHTDTGTGNRSSAMNDTEWTNPWDADNKEIYPRNEASKSSGQSAPLFDANAEFLEDEDTFAELDRQYHVAVDHDFMEDDELSNPIYCSPSSQQESKSNFLKDNFIKKENDILKPPEKNETLVKEEIVNQLQNLASIKLESLIIHNTEAKCDESSYDQNSETPLMTEEAKQSLNIDTKNKANKVIHSETTEMSTPTASSDSRKRSIDQRPSHRKEKRKKSQDKDESKKLICFKETSINKDKISRNSEKMLNDISKNCPDFKQSKENSLHSDNKKQSTNIRNNSEKDVKDKEIPIKAKSEDRKRQNSTSSNHSISPKNIACIQPTSSTKVDSNQFQSSLKSIDMFTEVPKKVNIHQAFRNTAVNKTPKQIAQIKPKPLISLDLKSEKKVEGFHGPKKYLSKETQTFKQSPSVTTRFTQTGKKKVFAKAIQVNIQPLEKQKQKKSTDALERMKQIDLEIQELLQEKFKLYSSLENKDGTAHIPMQNLGMTVLNVNSFENNKEENESDDLEDTIVNNFTNIPLEELEQIAFESEKTHSPSPARSQRPKRQKVSSNLQKDTNPYVKKNNKDKTPNFSLIEQIITDDRPLEDIISLDDLETTPIKQKKNQIKSKSSKKKVISKKKNKKSQLTNSIDLKECYILLLREDLNKYIIDNKLITKDERDSKSNFEVAEVSQQPEVTEPSIIPIAEGLDVQSNVCEEFVEETVISSDIQFDMLDVSEDIVIGEMIEEKAVTEKAEQVSVNEEIILDNSQSSMEDNATPVDTRGGECKLYDYLADENLQRDSAVASGNADAILAIECIGPNFLAAGLDGNVYYFNGDGQLISTLRGSNLAVTCLCVVKEKYGTTVYTGSLDSRIRNYDLETGLEKGPECNVLSPIQTMDRAWDTVFVGTRTGFVLQFECKNNLLIPVSTVKFSDQSILALRAMKEGPRKVLLVAARSENVTIKDAQTGLLLRTLNGPKMTVYTLLYEDGKVYCGTSSHQIQVFDYTSGTHVGSHEGGKGAVCLRAAGGLLFAGCYDGCIYVYREGESRPFAQLRGPSLMLLCLAIVGTKIIAGFKDRSVYIWKIPLSILQEMIL